MTTYTLGFWSHDPHATWSLFLGNMVAVGLGNLVGGALVVGLGYWVVGGRPRVRMASSPDELLAEAVVTR